MSPRTHPRVFSKRAESQLIARPSRAQQMETVHLDKLNRLLLLAKVLNKG